MNKQDVITIIQQVSLQQRRIMNNFRKQTTINRAELELLTFAKSNTAFNAYQAKKFFPAMNLQQVRTGIRKLVKIEAIELVGYGARNKPAMYMITTNGKSLLETYIKLWLPAFSIAKTIN